MNQKYSNDDEDEEDENLQEAEYHKKSDYSQAEKVGDAVDEVKKARGKEMREGFYNITNLPNGSVKKEYIEDTRKVFISSVEYLKSLLNNEIATSKKTKDSIKEFEKRKKKCFDEYSVNVQIVKNNRVVTLNKKYIPDMDGVSFSERPLQHSRTLKTWIEIKEIRGGYNPLVKLYWDEMVLIYDYLFQKLNNLIAEKNYFKQQTTY